MKQLGPYAIDGLLGTGGMSRVYKVIIPRIHKPAALKILHPHPHLVQLMGSAAIRRYFEHEAITMARIRHRHIAEVWDYDEHRGRPFYLMDYFDDCLALLMGESRRPDAPSRILPVPRAIYYTRQILDGLNRLHQAGVVHRDIKPFNVLITGHDTVKICDLGLSIHRGERFNAPKQLKIGSPWYAAPEQEENPDKVDPRADLFSIGVVLYRMLTGRLPGGHWKPPSTMNPLLNAAWDQFLKTATARIPAHRHRDAQTMGDDLDHLLARWRDAREAACQLSPPGKSARSSFLRLRRKASKVPLAQGPRVFGTDDLLRPVRYRDNRFVSDPRGDGRRPIDRTGLAALRFPVSPEPIPGQRLHRPSQRPTIFRGQGLAPSHGRRTADPARSAHGHGRILHQTGIRSDPAHPLECGPVHFHQRLVCQRRSRIRCTTGKDRIQLRAGGPGRDVSHAMTKCIPNPKELPCSRSRKLHPDTASTSAACRPEMGIVLDITAEAFDNTWDKLH